jgi:murein DD-endopeptidase MepM/ murein hydrolase activator NlpD
MRRPCRVAPLVSLLILAACGSPPPPPAPAAPPPPPEPPALEPARSYEVRSGLIRPNEPIGQALARVGIDIRQTEELVAALQGVFDFRKCRPGDGFRVTVAGGQVDAFEYRRGPVEEYLVRRDGDRLLGSARAFEIEKQVVQVSATITSSLFGAVQSTGEDQQLAVNLADILAWDIDFYMDPRKGDTFQVIVEKYVHDGKLVRYGDILAAEYKGELVGTKRVYRYPEPKTGNPSYYAEDGSATKRAFLKSPLKFANVTSRFGIRWHPVLQYVKAHEGVDFGAGIGTPVWAIGDGVVTHAGWAGACGIMVKLRHANGLETAYCHLSRLGEGVRAGVHVAQKRVIGFVGTTGRSTGPHLHYAVKRGGHFINPLSLKFPPSDPLPAGELPKFRETIAPVQARLGARVATMAAAGGPAAGPAAAVQ